MAEINTSLPAEVAEVLVLQLQPAPAGGLPVRIRPAIIQVSRSR